MSDIDIGQITEALNDKMDRDGVNAIPSEAFINNMFTAMLPDYNAKQAIPSLPFTASENGWLIGSPALSGGTETIIYVNGCIVGREAGDYTDIQMMIGEGDVVTGNSTQSLYFCPLRGANQ